jgi:zinc protease
MGYDLYPLDTVAFKEDLPAAADEGWVVFFEHDPRVGAGGSIACEGLRVGGGGARGGAAGAVARRCGRERAVMRCPGCSSLDNKVVDSRTTRDGDAIRRRRECLSCGVRFTTYEYVERTEVMVIKKDGRREPFRREKVAEGVSKACEKRPIPREEIEALLDRVENSIQSMGQSEVESRQIGEAVMEELARIDQIAYVRFASVYREFRDVRHFLDEIRQLLEHRGRNDEGSSRTSAAGQRTHRDRRTARAGSVVSADRLQRGIARRAAGITGISHLLEHMMFKGTEKYGKGDVATVVERNGGELNAFTSEDVTMYYEVFARDRWQLAGDRERAHGNLRIDADELESERQVVLEERVMYLDIPAVELGEELAAAAFRESPYRWPIIGWEYDIKAITRDDLLEHYRRYYAPGNATLVVVGDVEPAAAFAAAERHFGAMPAAAAIERRIPREPELKGVLRLGLDRAATLPHLQILFRAPQIHTKDAEALSLLANILSGSRTARLDMALLETNKAGDVQVHFHPKSDPSAFTIGVEGQPAIGLDEVEEIVWRELAALASGGVDADELERARNQVEAHQVFAMQSPSNRGFALGWHEAHGDVGCVDTAVERLMSLTADELRDAAQRWFRPDRCAIARIVGPDGGATRRVPADAPDSALAAGIARPAALQRAHGRAARTRVRLANGMNVVLQSDRTDPVVSVSLLFEAGGAADPPDRQGLASLAADTMERGPKDRDFVTFTRDFERLQPVLAGRGRGAGPRRVDAAGPARHDGLSLVADLLESPGLREADLEIVRQLALNDLEAREDDLDDVAEDRLLRDIAADHPYARLPHGTKEGLAAATVDDLRRFCAEAYRPDHAHLAIVGDFDETEIVKFLERRFARLPAPSSPRPPQPAFAARPGPRTAVLTRADKAQAKICLGGPGLAAVDRTASPRSR